MAHEAKSAGGKSKALEISIRAANHDPIDLLLSLSCHRRDISHGEIFLRLGSVHIESLYKGEDAFFIPNRLSLIIQTDSQI